MALCGFGDAFAMFDSTPVENLFIEEYMLRAPGDFVKVYLYGLKLCYHGGQEMTMGDMARDLSQDEEAIMDAFAYWERQGLVQRMSDRPPSFAFFNLKQRMIHKSVTPQEDGLYEYRDFNNALQMLFGKKLLHPQDFQKIFDWVEVLKLPKEVVLLMVEHTIEKRGERVSIAYLDKIAVAWAQEDIRTLADAKAYLLTQTLQHDMAKAVLRHLGLRRAPTVSETALCKTWLSWGFSQEAVLFACREMNKIGQPNFEYLNKVLGSHHLAGRVTLCALEEYLHRKEEGAAPVREVLYALGQRGISPTKELADMVSTWLSWGFSLQSVLGVCAACVQEGRSRMEDVQAVLAGLRDAGVLTPEAIAAFLKQKQEQENTCAQILRAMGVERRPTEAETARVQTWIQAGFALPALLYAAQKSAMASQKMPFLSKIVTSWQAKGIFTLKAAQNESASRMQPPVATSPDFANAQSKRAGKEVAEHRYTQREYAPGELDALFEDLEAKP